MTVIRMCVHGYPDKSIPIFAVIPIFDIFVHRCSIESLDEPDAEEYDPFRTLMPSTPPHM